MAANPGATFVSVEEYLERQRTSDSKCEYFNGEIFPMFATTPHHALIVNNVGGELRTRLKSAPCRVYTSDLMVRVTATGLYTYPDVTVICGDPQYTEGRPDGITNPSLIVEVLAPSTEDYDRGKKFEHYRTLPTLIDYLTIAQDKPHIECFTRQAENRWLLIEFAELTQKIELTSIQCVLPLSEIYDKAVFPSPAI
ncbi:MAG TPA: Uma2 family endonuclease [Bryobacteraceae bacterium]|nr:Uma2 family endonuclease [Bryobacteraceae bacterium]